MPRDRINYNRWMMEWRQKHKQRYLELARKSYIKNRDKIIQRSYKSCDWQGCDGKTTSRFCLKHAHISVSQSLLSFYKDKISPQYKGGRKKSHDYWFILKPEHHNADCNGYVLEHRLIYEEYYKVCILKGIDCHHINGNPTDNRIENLELRTHSNHISLHVTENWKNGIYKYDYATHRFIKR